MKRFPRAARRQAFGIAARLRRLVRSKNGRAVGAATAMLIILTLLRVYDPWIVNELKEQPKNSPAPPVGNKTAAAPVPTALAAQ